MKTIDVYNSVKVMTTVVLLACLGIVNTQAQTCNATPTVAGFSTTGTFGGCYMAFEITYNCGAGNTVIVCALDANGDGFDLPSGCCINDLKIYPPYQAAQSVDPSVPTGTIIVPGSGLTFPVGSGPCDRKEVSTINWDFSSGHCNKGLIIIK